LAVEARARNVITEAVTPVVTVTISVPVVVIPTATATVAVIVAGRAAR
jgi:hypothetical protein